MRSTECGSDWSHQVSAAATTRWLQHDQTLSLSAKGMACKTKDVYPSLYLEDLKGWDTQTDIPVNVEWRYNLREGEVLGNCSWDTHLVDGQVWVRSDDGTGGKIHPLSHEVSPHAPLLAL